MINLASGVVFSSFALFLLIRYRIKMTSLLTWIVGSLRSKNSISTSPEEDKKISESKSTSNKQKAQSKGGKLRQRLKKSNEEPTFSTKLATPIEDVIEETINEEVKPANKKKGKSVKRSEELPQKKSKQDSVDTVGYSFFNVKSVSKVNSDNKSKKSSPVDLNEDNQIDDIGFSFLPVKEKGKKYKSKSNVDTDQHSNVAVEQKLKNIKHDPTKIPIIDHFQKRRTNENVLPKKFLTKTGKPQNSVSTVVEKRLLYENQLNSEQKESKKVSSTVSYASIVVNSVSDIPTETNAELESLNFIESNSSSLEILNENIVKTQNCEESANFEFIEKKLNTLLNDETDYEEVVEKSLEIKVQDNLSKHSSICVIDNQEFEENQESSNNDQLLDTNTRLDKETENRSIQNLTDLSISNSFVNSEENITDKSTPSEVFLSFEKDKTETESTNSAYNFENTSYFQSEESQSSNFSQYSFEKEVHFVLENKTEVETSNYNFEQSYLHHQESLSSSNYIKDFSSVEHSFTELVGNSEFVDNYSADTNSSYFQSEQIPSSYSQDFQTGNSEEQFKSDEHYVLKSNSSIQEDLHQIVEEVIDAEHSEINHFKTEREESNLLHNQSIDQKQTQKNTYVAEFKKENQYLEQQSLINTFENQTFIDEEKLFYNFEGKSKVQEKRDRLKEVNFAESVSYIPHSEEQSPIEEEQNFTYITSGNQIETEETVEDFTDTLTTANEQEEQIELSEEDQGFVHVESLPQEEEIINKTLQNHIEESTIQEFVHVETPENQQIGKNLIQQQSCHIEEEQNTITFIQNQFGRQEETIKFIETEKKLAEQLQYHQTEDTFEAEQLDFEKMKQIRVLTLNDREHQECTLYRIEKNWVIQFRIGPSLFGRKVYLYCNYNSSKEFNRNKYQLLEWITEEGCENADDTAHFAEIKAELAGSFHYYFTYEKGETLERQGSGYFLVDPVLKYGQNEDLPLDCIQCQTVLAKSLGSFSSWEKKLQVAKESGYNMIHFTPIQELGASNSAYSLSEQLKLNSVFRKSDGKMPSFEEIERFTAHLRKDWKVASICDIVLNHTANESKWIQEHPEVTYNCVNCPYMRPAYLLDAAFDFFSSEVKKGNYENKGIPADINNEDHLNAIRYHFRTNILDGLKIHEMFTCDPNKCVSEFLALARLGEPHSPKRTENSELQLIQDPEFRRLKTTVDLKLALNLYNAYWTDTFDEDSRLKKCAEQFKNKLDDLNNRMIDEINNHLSAAIDNVIAGIRYFRVQHDGPKFKEISIKTPLVYRYFTDYGSPKTLQEFEDIMYSDKGKFLMAHNGWVMNSDPLRNFAAADSKVYLRRELIAWGDSVKLRFGDKPEDCPFLWDHMKKYVEQTARIFDGVRLDNCHSTPIPVAEYLLDCARKVRPDLYVVAELFTNSDMTDNIFVNRLGITSLIREAMSAWDSHEEGRLVYRYGGVPVGSFHQPNIRPLIPSVAHALFLDQTHDNPSPVDKRSVFDLLPSTALVNMACCASGSNRGYDELVPHHIHVVDEDREYTEWTTEENLSMGNLRYVTNKSGIIKAKKAINDLHFLLGHKGFNQVYVDQMDSDIVAVTRHCPVTHQSYILVAFTAFGHPSENAGNHQRGIKPLRFEGVLEEIVIEATLSHVNYKSGGSKFAKWQKFVKDSKWINGLSEYNVTVKEHIQVSESDVFEKVDSGTQHVTQLNFKNFKPGSIVVVKSSLPEGMRTAVKSVRNLISSITSNNQSELTKIVNKLTLADLNRILYRCDQEERDEGFGFDTYNIPNFGTMVYAGLQGFMSLLANIRPNNDLGHPMCANLRDGNWMIDYIWKRLKLDQGTKELGDWIEQNTKHFSNIPRYLVPCYFDLIITSIYLILLDKTYNLMSGFVKKGSTFVKGLALGSVQFGAYIKSADLPTLSPNLAPPKPSTRTIDNKTIQTCITLSAGLPHFSVGYMRNWGRDTFIALRGLFILTGRYQEAREHILGYGACLRHGLIPNLLDGGRNSRFNCRDAIWWWLYCIKEYVNEAPNGIDILTDKVSRIFPTDDAEIQPPGAVDQLLRDIIQESLKIHFQGLVFRERNAGRQIDEHMTDQGFNNQIGVHPQTGFIFGGNKWNCGTWMDKMGSSDKARNRGKPATPRDGSAVELVGLSKAVISWLAKLNDERKYPYSGVERVHKNGKTTNWTFKEWAKLIQDNFENYFWVNSKPTEGEIRPDLINKRGIYKDSHGSSLEYTDFQLRCNFPIAMIAAPELFTPSQAWEALNQAEKYLLGPLGMKTLDPEDWAYRGDYDNSNQSDDPTVSNGFNYHQGPEWVWPIGFFLRAKLIFAAQNGTLKETVASTKLILSKHFVELQTSDWRGLPELTNSNGAYCNDSSRTQAWSMSCILEVLYDLKKIEANLDLLGN